MLLILICFATEFLLMCTKSSASCLIDLNYTAAEENYHKEREDLRIITD